MVNESIRTTFLKFIDVIKSYFGGTLPIAFTNLATSENYEIPYFIFDKESSLIFLKSPKSTFSDSNSSHVNIMLIKLFTDYLTVYHSSYRIKLLIH